MTASKTSTAKPAKSKPVAKDVDHSLSNKIISGAIAKGDLTLPKPKTAADAVARAKELAANAPKAKPADKKADKTTGNTVRAGKAAPEPKVEKAPKVTKPSKVAVEFVARSVKSGTPVHAIAEQARPVAGIRLFAHTHAALTMLGMLDPTRPAVPEKGILTVMGQRAVSYHKKMMNFESGPDHTLRLSISGRNKFVGRFAEGNVDPAMANAFLALFIDGKADPLTSVTPGNVYQTVLA